MRHETSDNDETQLYSPVAESNIRTTSLMSFSTRFSCSIEEVVACFGHLNKLPKLQLVIVKLQT